ncbi:MAG TPA: ubiquitin-like small modifier protein 1 [Anaerolineales bacterium]
MRVNFYATLRQTVGAKAVDFPLPSGTTVRQLIDEMCCCYPALRKVLLDENGELFQHVHLFIKGRDATFLDNGLDTPIEADETIGLFPAVGGG